jgi:hypothetical protein
MVSEQYLEAGIILAYDYLFLENLTRNNYVNIISRGERLG